MSDRIRSAIEAAEGSALCAYLTGGFPDPAAFPETLMAVAAAADVVEIGVPFTDPMADGLTIQEASRRALDAGATLEWFLDTLAETGGRLEAPYVLMGYYNPFFAFGLDRLAVRMAEAGVSGVIVPDLPLEESGPMAAALDGHGLGMVRLVTPSTPPSRMVRLAAASSGFVYAVTSTGVTGGEAGIDLETLDYLARVRAGSTLPVLAGFGVRHRRQVEALALHVDGVVVGSALIEAVDRGDDPGAFLEDLRPREAGR
ncbi:MAG: tryptophan synthase subunit alpha [Acidimicrobiia bacterium]